jgi:hypothetical protein
MLSVSGFTVSDAEEEVSGAKVPSVLLRQPVKHNIKAKTVIKAVIFVYFIISSETFFLNL